MLQADLIRPDALTAQDRDAWRALCAAEPAFRSPLLSPEFAQAVGRVREDATIAVFRRRGRTLGFLPHHRRPGGLGRPIGAPFSDVHALITADDPGFSGADALFVAGLKAFRYGGLTDPHGLFGAPAQTREGFLIELETSGEQGAEAYLEGLRSASPKRFKNWRRLDHKLDRELGPLSITAPDRDGAAFDLILQWKREQLKRTGLHDLLRPAWVQGLMRQQFAANEGPLQGLMITLRAGDRLVAGHFGVRLGTSFHPWIASVDPELAAYSPGQTFLTRAIAAMPGLGLEAYDLSVGHEHYKAPYANRRPLVSEGVTFAAGARTPVAPALLKAMAPGDAAGRLGRRLDQIAAVELDMADRLRGVIEAGLGWGRRERSRQPVEISE
jgi:CelD/BcsL family acetyltransferase involved in cellulose biosynthesis